MSGSSASDKGALDDRQYRASIRNHDEDAWDGLVAAYSTKLTSLVTTVLPRHFDREDAVSEAWVRAYARVEGYDPGRPLLPWLYQICRNVCYTRLAHRARELEVLKRVAEGKRGHARCETRPSEVVSQLLISRLPPTLRQAVVLRYVFDIPAAEVAEILSITKSAVRQRIGRARKLLSSFAGEYLADSAQNGDSRE